MCLSLTGSAGNDFLGVIGPGAELLKIAPYYASLHVLTLRKDLMVGQDTSDGDVISDSCFSPRIAVATDLDTLT